MALGSQKWNGNCALLVNVPTSINTSAAVRVGDAGICGSCATMVLMLVVPIAWPSRMKPASSARPPVPVTSNRRHEEGQQPVQPPLLRVTGQIAAGIDEHRRAHARDHQQHQRRQPVDVEGELDPRARHPGPAGLDRQIVVAQQPQHPGQRRHRQQGERHPRSEAEAGVRCVRGVVGVGHGRWVAIDPPGPASSRILRGAVLERRIPHRRESSRAQGRSACPHGHPHPALRPRRSPIHGRGSRGWFTGVKARPSVK